ncbi:hypothetical protein NSND_60737 [Nitrospira sp. ND1]|nr:hypothetical protein NSND_60737 [Nitrospira sp. ND1]
MLSLVFVKSKAIQDRLMRPCFFQPNHYAVPLTNLLLDLLSLLLRGRNVTGPGQQLFLPITGL